MEGERERERAQVGTKGMKAQWDVCSTGDCMKPRLDGEWRFRLVLGSMFSNHTTPEVRRDFWLCIFSPERTRENQPVVSVLDKVPD